MKKIILADVDGVLLLWIKAFEDWMLLHGYEKKTLNVYDIEDVYEIPTLKADQLTRQFNESAAIGFLPPFRDAVKYVKKLHKEHEYHFHCITSVSESVYVHKLRKENLQRVFGLNAVKRLVCVDSSSAKYPVLSEYKDTGYFWIEDLIKNAEMGIDLGLRPLLMDHDYNRAYTNKYDIQRAKNWKEIYNIITQDE